MAKSKEARFIFIPEIQDLDTEFTYNFFEKDEREDISDRYRITRDKQRLTRNEIDNISRFVTIKFSPHAYPFAHEEDFSIKENINNIINEDEISNKNFIGFQFQDTNVEDSFYYSTKLFLQTFATLISESPVASLAQMQLLTGDGNDDAFLSEVFTNIEIAQPTGDRGVETDISRVQHTAAFSPIRDLSFGGYFSNENVNFISADMTIDDTSPYADEFLGKFSNFRATHGASTISDNDQKLTIIKQRRLEENEEVKPKSYIIGYIIEKSEILKNNKLKKMDPIIIQGKNRGSIVDKNVRYGGAYRYCVKTISTSFFEATSLSSRDTKEIRVEAVALIASGGSKNSDIICDEKIPPDPPCNLLFKFDYATDSLFFSWDFPLNVQRDIKRFQIYRRKSIKEPFALLREYNFDDSTIKGRSPASGNTNNVKVKASPELVFIDTEFNMNSKYIYALASIDARGLTSGYSAQFEVSYDRFKNRIKSTYISGPNAPKTYPNIYLEKDTFPDVIKASNYKNIRIFFNPEYEKVIKTLDDGETAKIDVIKTSSRNKYKIQIINTDLQEVASYDFFVVK